MAALAAMPAPTRCERVCGENSSWSLRLLDNMVAFQLTVSWKCNHKSFQTNGGNTNREAASTQSRTAA